MSAFDLQVNGYGGVDFNQDDLGAEDLQRACELLEAHGAGGILATIITEHPDRMESRIRRLRELRETVPLARRIIAGIHIEGPFLNPADGYRGAHPLDAIKGGTVSLMDRLVEAGGGLVRLVTLAPEMDASHKVVRCLISRNIAVSAGHTDASLNQLRGAIDAGLTLFTHLGNGCPALLPRHDNIIQRALSLRQDLWLCFICDGVHIPFDVLRNYLDLIGPEGKAIATTDAMSAAGLGPGRRRLGRWEVEVGADYAARSPDGSHLVGSAIPIPQLKNNLETKLRLNVQAVRRLTESHPRQALGLGSPIDFGSS
ncbi:MAG TPA: hypothetical protein VGC39_04315 [Candidatus Methylacidiphilales bacterium]